MSRHVLFSKSILRLVSQRVQSGMPLCALHTSARTGIFPTGIKSQIHQQIQRSFKTFKNKPPAKGQKLKVKSGVKKRFRKIANGKLKYKKAGMRHKLRMKTSKRKRTLSKKVEETICKAE